MNKGWLTCSCGIHFEDDVTLQLHQNATKHRDAVKISVTIPDPPVAGPADAPQGYNAKQHDKDVQRAVEAAEAAFPRPADVVRPGTGSIAEVEAFTRLMAFVRERTTGGCKMFSLGDACICPLCDLDRLRAARASVEAQEERELLKRIYNITCGGEAHDTDFAALTKISQLTERFDEKDVSTRSRQRSPNGEDVPGNPNDMDESILRGGTD